LIGLLQSHDADIKHVAEVIAHDPAIAANVLKAANSAANVPSTKIQSIQLAVMRVGLRGTTALVLDQVVAKHTARVVTGYDLGPGALRDYSAAAAIATESLAAAQGQAPPPEAFTAGLLQDIGKLVLGHFVKIDSKPILELAFEKQHSFEEAERIVLGIDHAEVGAILLDAWGIGGTIRDAVCWHHAPESSPEASREVTRLVHCAGLIVNLMGIGGGSDGSHYRPSGPALGDLGVRPKIVEQVMRETVSRLDSLQGICS
jgi:HD-like signal output (HDOD) protein